MLGRLRLLVKKEIGILALSVVWIFFFLGLSQLLKKRRGCFRSGVE
jgi:hypothetical protein